MRACPKQVDPRRVRALNRFSSPRAGGRAVLYWMSREQRVDDNWALLRAQEAARELELPLHVAFHLAPGAGGRNNHATLRSYGFMLRGLEEVERGLRARRIPFHLLRDGNESPSRAVPRLAAEIDAATVVTDISPLREPLRWVAEVGEALEGGAGVQLLQVDAHNIVPVWVASDKQEVGARTLRPRIHRHLPSFLTEFPAVTDNPTRDDDEDLPAVDWEEVRSSALADVDRDVGEVSWATPGATAGRAMIDEFLAERLGKYADRRNDPNEEAQSCLSPWVNFGQIAPQRCALAAKACGTHGTGVAAFIEESVVRRELSDNYCFYRSDYDTLAGAAGWARESLELHASDEREFVYTQAQFAAAETHDPLWNAAQRQLVSEGKMHGFLRMYWAKKVLEWAESPEEALRIALYLNDRYSLDGRDPNGFVGVAWSVMGIHDMGWKERPIFGKIRYMNLNGCKRKFDVRGFEARYPGSGDFEAGKIDSWFSTATAAAGKGGKKKKHASGGASNGGAKAKKAKTT